MGVARLGNFASKPTRPVRAVTAAIWALVVLAAGVVVWSVLDVRNLQAERATLSTHQARLTEELAALRDLATDAPTTQEIAALAERTTAFNALTGPRAAPLLDVLALLETVLPVEVRISQLVYDAEAGRLALALQAFDEADLPPALRVLEASDKLDDVILERQLRIQQGTRTIVQYDIRAVAP
ncbi:hypothetical protein [Yoonia sediminilitoris]|uniref:Uncharacterized protein n=1 Tax=Yoonia sediminilitoris TaxID=1286148 RepID=A0A2T6KLG6_9RHOB|nr:hypothetical protein [Yoonia sediminilitoris]PUB17053.1 hypothetical protein C8N45_10263 [Yoonia sediminilitoris]RCW97348.1 hypothetical protein DFP92_10263 [Yoonia sediminilitoris]